GAFSRLCGHGDFVKNLSNSVQKRFTYWRAGCGILSMSMREAAIPNRHSLPIFYFSFYPPLFCEMTGKRPGSVPPRTGAFPCFCRRGDFVKNLSNSVQKWFTLFLQCCGIL